MPARGQDNSILNIQLRRFVYPIPEKADHIRMVEITPVESQQHFVILLRHEKHSSAAASQWCGNRSPGTFGSAILERGEFYLDAALTLRVFQVRHNAQCDAYLLFHDYMPPSFSSSRRALKRVV